MLLPSFIWILIRPTIVQNILQARLAEGLVKIISCLQKVCQICSLNTRPNLKAGIVWLTLYLKLLRITLPTI